MQQIKVRVDKRRKAKEVCKVKVYTVTVMFCFVHKPICIITNVVL
jgi:hypothetical protein